MTEGSPDVTEVEPLEIKRLDERTNGEDGEFVRFEATVHPSLSESGSGVDLPHRRWLIDNPDEHLHPQQEEVIEVLSGEYAVAFDGREHRLTDSEEITLPMNTPHRHWNPTEQPVRVAHEHHPARQSDELTETIFALAQAEKTNEKGIPNPLQFAVIMNAYPEHAYTTDLPVSVQKALFALLGPIGHLAGYKATYTRQDISNLQ